MSPYQRGLDLVLAAVSSGLPTDVVWLIRCFCFDPPHPGCRRLLLGSMTFHERASVRRVSTGHKHLAFVTDDGRAFTHGSNALGQCALPAITVHRTLRPAVVMESATDVSCGSAFTIATTEKMVYFCGAYNYHPETRRYDACLSITDTWVPLCFASPPARVHASGSYAHLRWDSFHPALPILSKGSDKTTMPSRPNAFDWGGHRYRGRLCGHRARWMFLETPDKGVVCSACGRGVAGSVVMTSHCCVMHLDCWRICFVKGGCCPCGNALEKNMGV